MNDPDITIPIVDGKAVINAETAKNLVMLAASHETGPNSFAKVIFSKGRQQMKRVHPLLIALCFHAVDCACFSTARHAMDYLEETSYNPAWALPLSGFVAIGGAFMKQYIEDASK